MTGLHLLVGLGDAGRAVARALLRRGQPVLAVDDRPDGAARQAAADLGLDLVVAPGPERLAQLVGQAAVVVPDPGLPERHAAFGLAARHGVPVLSELDLAARWDDRPLLAVTGTPAPGGAGVATVASLVCAMLEASGLAARAAGTAPVPLVAAIDDPMVDVFVVEASTSSLGRSDGFAPTVGAWLGAASGEPEAAQAGIWRHQSADQVAVGNADDPLVRRHLEAAPARHVGFGLEPGAGYRVDGDVLVTDGGDAICPVDELPGAAPDDLRLALAASATALHGGGSLTGVASALRSFGGSPDRLTLVGESGGALGDPPRRSGGSS